MGDVRLKNNMQELLSKSAKVVNSNVALVVISGICNLQVFSGIMAYVSAIGILVSFIVCIIIYGRISEQVVDEHRTQWLEILKTHWLNYVVVASLLSIPAIIFTQLIMQLSTAEDAYIYEREAIKFIIYLLAIYVLPIVFIKKQHIIAILAGVTYLFQHLKNSIPIIILVVIMFVINLLLLQWFIQISQSPEGVISLLPVIALFNIGISYLSFLIYAAACIVLIKSPRVSVNHGA